VDTKHNVMPGTHTVKYPVIAPNWATRITTWLYSAGQQQVHVQFRLGRVVIHFWKYVLQSLPVALARTTHHRRGTISGRLLTAMAMLHSAYHVVRLIHSQCAFR
jgi:hypothetical protein